MITNFFIPELNNHDVQELWFQQDGATCHTARATINLLKDTFGDRLISRFGPVNWPPRSCDLTPLDYFLWGYVKSLVYADKPQTLDHLEDNIRRVIADIRPQMLEKVIENWTSRLDYIRASRGSPMPEIIFKIPFPDLPSSDSAVLSGLPIAEGTAQRLPQKSSLSLEGLHDGSLKSNLLLGLRLSSCRPKSIKSRPNSPVASTSKDGVIKCPACEEEYCDPTTEWVQCSTRGLLATDHVILNHGQVTWTTPELAPPLLTTTPHQREDVSALDRFNVHRCPTRRVFSGTGLKPVTKQATVRYLYHSATAATFDDGLRN
ncbi:uncharacterized protein TNCV_3068521 [Trichonephila clavipes]|nr:uncharacterized protein TNCV_3068521 [Trichonephila clavipes]